MMNGFGLQYVFLARYSMVKGFSGLEKFCDVVVAYCFFFFFSSSTCSIVFSVVKERSLLRRAGSFVYLS